MVDRLPCYYFEFLFHFHMEKSVVRKFNAYGQEALEQRNATTLLFDSQTNHKKSSLFHLIFKEQGLLLFPLLSCINL